MDRAQLLNDAEESLRLALDGRQSTLWTALPCIVQKVNWDQMTCEAQPAIQGSVEDENGVIQSVNLPLLINVPIVFPSAGGFTLTLPLAADDEVLVVIASRCIDAWWQSGGIQRPMEARMHDLSDGFAIPGPRSVPNVLSGISSTAAQLRNDDGTAYIEIGPTGLIKLVSVTGVEVDGNLVVTGSITGASMATSGGGSVTIAGGLNVTGGITAATVAAGGIGLTTHKHTGVTTGGGTSGGPTP